MTPPFGNILVKVAGMAIGIAAIVAAIIFIRKDDSITGSVRETSPPEIGLGPLVRSNGILSADLKLININSLPTTSAEINCVVLTASGSEISRYRFTIFESIPAKSSKTISNYRFGAWPRGGNSVECESNKAFHG